MSTKQRHLLRIHIWAPTLLLAMAARVASMDDRVTHVGFLSGSGASQIFDMVMLASRSEQEPHSGKHRIEDVYGTFSRIMAEPDRIDQWVWGHTYKRKRWASLARTSPVFDLAHSDAYVFLAYGDADESVAVGGTDLLYSELFARGKRVRVERISGGDHSLNRPGEPPFQRMSDIVGSLVAWVLED